MEDLEEHLPWVKGIASGLFKRYGLSQQGFNLDELVNIGYEALYKAAGKYRKRGDATLKTFAFMRVRGEIINHVNRQLRDWRRELQILNAGGDEEHSEREYTESATMAHTLTPIEVLLEQDKMEALEDCMKRLRPELREVWYLRFQEMTFERIGIIMSISLVTAKRYHDRVIQLMKSCLEEKGWA